MTKQAELNFKELIDEYYAPLYRFAFSLAKNEHEACDLTQQTFVVFATKGSSIRDTSKVKSWLFTTLYREFLRQRNKQSNVTPQEPEILEAEAPIVQPQVLHKLEHKSALSALQEIDETYRAPLVLFYLKDFSYKEIAEVLEVPMGTVMSRLSRGKAILKSVIEARNKKAELR